MLLYWFPVVIIVSTSAQIITLKNEESIENPNIVHIQDASSSKTVCISMYVAVPKNCLLDIKTQRSKKTITGFNTNAVKYWKRIEIEVENYNSTGNLEFSSGKNCPYLVDSLQICKPAPELHHVKFLFEKKPEVSNFGAKIRNKREVKPEDKSSRCECPCVKTVLIFLSVQVLVELLLGLTCYFYLKKKFPFGARKTAESKSEEELQLFGINEPSTKIPIRNLEYYVKNMILKSSAVIEQFESISTKTAGSYSAANQPRNVNKNKDKENVPYDSTRVVLKKLPGVGNTEDYINASFINAYDRPKLYIAAQAPKFYTVSDFWRMVWQENVETIIMVTDFIENDERMCAEYWTQRLNAVFECGELTVRSTFEECNEHYDSRTLEVHYVRHRRDIRHIQLKWSSDDQKPIYPNDILPVVKKLREISENSTTPIVIHSGFGINRCGTLILCDMALQMAKNEESVDFCQLVTYLREQRPNMVNKKEYYLLAHFIVLESLLESENPFKDSLEENLDADAIEQQINYLNKLCVHDTIVKSWTKQETIKSPLNPVFVDGYQQTNKFIVAKQPKEKQVRSFWFLAATEKVDKILLLHFPKTNLWPHVSSQDSIVVKVTLRDKPDYTSSFTQTYLSVLIYNSTTKDVVKQSDISVFQLNGWEPKYIQSQSPQNLLDVRCEISKKDDQSRILVACHNGVDSSVVVSLFYLLEKYEKELQVNLCNALRIVKRSDSRFLNKAGQLKFLYTAALEYLQNFDKYKHVDLEVIG